MILHVLCFKNALINSFTTPNFVDTEPEKAAVQLARSFALSFKSEPEKVSQYESLVLYHIADFDDQTGKLIPLASPVLLLNCIDVINDLKVRFNNVPEQSSSDKPKD